MEFKEYLKTILDQKQIEDLLAAAEEGKTIIIKGKQGPTGKSTLKSILSKKGIKAIEEYETFEIFLDKDLETPIANFETTVCEKNMTLKGKVQSAKEELIKIGNGRWTREAKKDIGIAAEIVEFILKKEVSAHEAKFIFRRAEEIIARIKIG